jgi:energy-coupling factor transport system substrate-specific component
MAQNNNNNNTGGLAVRTVVAIGIGAALFFVLMRFLPIPTGVPDTTINLGSAILALFAAIFGPIAGLFIGLIGHSLNDLTWGSVWWSWVIADGVFGLLLGLIKNRLDLENGNFTKGKLVLFNIWQAVAGLIAWVVVAPVGDILIYKEPVNKVFVQGLVAWGTTFIAVAVVGSILIVAYAKTRTKTGSLSKEN